MAKGDRTGNRKTREQRKMRKAPELGYYLIVTDTEGTERCFFTGLYQSLPEEIRNKIVIKVVETKTRSMIDKCLELAVYEAQYELHGEIEVFNKQGWHLGALDAKTGELIKQARKDRRLSDV